jgi:hypothetical protein
MDTIDLGRESGGGSIPAPTTSSESKEKYYPSLYIDLDNDELDDIPECGTMTVYFRRTSKTVREQNGKETASVSLEIQKILDVEEDEEEEKSDRKKTEDTLDKYAAEEASKK